MNGTPIEFVVNALGETNGRTPQTSGTGWRCCCPAHVDRNPSLSVSEADDGRVLLHCQAGCSLDDVLRAAGLQKRDLFPAGSQLDATPRLLTQQTTPSHHRRRKLAASNPPRSWLRSGDAIAVLERKLGERSFAWTYHDAARRQVGMVIRWDQADGTKDIRPLRFTRDGWQIGAMAEPRPMFRLPEIIEAEMVFIVEGELAATAAESIGLPVTTSSGGSNAASKTDWSPVAGKNVVIIPDNDEAGAKYAGKVADIALRLVPPATVRIVDLKDDWPKLPVSGDLADWSEHFCELGPAELRTRIEALVERSESLSLTEPRESPTDQLIRRRAVLQRFSEIEPESIHWLWPGRIPSGMLTVVSGNPGEGKSMVLTDIVARVTTGSEWPDGAANGERGDVILINAEDAVAAVQRPRLDASGADVCRVRRISGVELRSGEDVVEERQFSIMDAAQVLRSAIEQLDQPCMIVLDPLAAFLAGVRSNDQGHIRAAFSPLVHLAEEFDVAIVLVHHNRKGTGSHASERLAGSLQIGATVRQSWEVVADPEEPDRRMFLPGKNSNAKRRGGLAFRIEDSEIRQSQSDGPSDCVGRVRWEAEAVDLTADQVARIEMDEESRDPWPVEWLRDHLGNGPKHAKVALTAAKADGITEKQLRTARRRLGVNTRKAEFQGGWIWELPEQMSGLTSASSVMPESG